MVCCSWSAGVNTAHSATASSPAPPSYRQANNPRKPPAASFAVQRFTGSGEALRVFTFLKPSSRPPPNEQPANESGVRLDIGRQ